jgi:hypothetical protein
MHFLGFFGCTKEFGPIEKIKIKTLYPGTERTSSFRVAKFFLVQYTKTGEKINIKFPNDHNIYQMAV